MARLRVFEAAIEGFRLIRREPLAPLAWGGALFVVIGLPMAALFGQMAPMFLQLSETLRGLGEAFTGPPLSVFVLTPLIYVFAVIGYVLVAGAVARAVIRPDDRRWLYLRLDRREWWMGVSAVVGLMMAYIGFFLAFLVLALLFVAPTALLDPNHDGSSPALTSAILAITLAWGAAATYLALRFSMAPLMSFGERRFRLFESWRFTRGEGWRLVGLAALMLLGGLFLELMLAGGFLVAFGSAFLDNMADPAVAEALAARMAAFYASPWVVVAMAALYLIGGYVFALIVAPFARAYLMLRGSPSA